MTRRLGRPRSEVQAKADFSRIRYAQVWEDADVLLEALRIRPGDRCLSIASAGDNALAMLTQHPASVVALDLSAPQIHCLELRAAAFRALEHPELLELVGSVPSARRRGLYQRCRPLLSPDARRFWDAQPVERGIGRLGKFERYFALFRRFVLPFLLSGARVRELLTPKPEAERAAFFERHFNTGRYRLLMRLFFSRFVMGRLGRDPAFFDHAEGSVSAQVKARTRHALTELEPAHNPYLRWILLERHDSVLPLYLRPEHFATIRANLDRLSWQRMSLEEYLAQHPEGFERANLSDVFEYMSEEATEALLGTLAARLRPGGRLVYWNMIVPRSRPESLAHLLEPRLEEAERLHRQDKAFFYSRLVIEERK
ncbi:hypothetical protein Mterra_04000 [Calidithermus terrae]|uniref:S-adenosylmethionine:diacylglycerol 3-amino-3-carboxypropyl transferase n=1 Tax=Calidithermus terrae TaxID=1408545 RepID=A0A399DYH1_9DEIN|nr:DUF3419 family protein [Calidithermus terrae]RIH75241.1 hypothetical protein Mterra_04000 [Calidithermus terrae]